MGITTCYRASHLTLDSCYVKISRIWGAKDEGWNAWFGVFEKEGLTTPIEQFSLNVPYVEDENPFKVLYAAAEKLDFLNPIKLQVEVTPVIQENDQEEIAEEKVKPVKTKKVKK